MRIVYSIAIILVIACISLLPQPLLVKYAHFMNAFLAAILLPLLISKRREKMAAHDAALFIYFLCVSSGLFFAEDRRIALDWYRLYILPIPFVYFFMRLLDTQSSFKVLYSIIFFGAVVSLLGIAEGLLHKNMLYENWIFNPYYQRFIQNRPARVTSTMFHPVILGTYLAVGTTASLIMALKSGGRFIKISLWLSFILMFVCMSLTFSRGSIFAIAFSLGIYFWLAEMRRIAKLCIIGGIVLIFLFHLLQRNSSFGMREISPISSQVDKITVLPMPIGFILDSALFEYNFRRERFTVARRMLEVHPIIGIGLNHYRAKFDKYKNNGVIPDEFKVTDNSYLSILAETGILGFVSFMIFVGLLVRRGFKSLYKSSNFEGRALLTIAFYGLLVLLVNINSPDSLYWMSPFYSFWIFAGLVARGIGTR